MAYADEVAIVIAAEACSEGYEEMRAVANVIANRSVKYNLTPVKVVTQPHQFDGYTHPNKYGIYVGCKEEADYLSRNLMEIEDTTDGALYFRRFGSMGHIYFKKGEFDVQ